MNNSIISKEAFDILKVLAKNNNKEWFEKNKSVFKKHESEVKSFFESVKERLSQHDDIEKMKMFRIYRDVRFSKDKTPYKTHFAGSFSRLGAHLRGGYYIHLQPGNSLLATGFWAPNKEDLFRIRKELEMDASDFRKIISDPDFKKIWGELQGDAVKTAPKGFDKDHPDIGLIKNKQYVFVRNFTDQEVLSPNFIEDVDKSYRAIRPYFDLMSDILTTNLNGESML
ncbi:DUF2461 domain-containing protein [Flagellimonas alvinocaridis]|uniref:DUF2461 domain-containing protein n=1 Tax=Flagellimonas alvinocaridis TaxID=2530200 RepID=A0A4S8RK59_9FLAO|nr:DUF2461 domain-containing protein [Allomuricauda alvinocaridis]THV58011.1 DUF2461 domain-containing protein [Allomuricauda alvinocaridis]